MDGKMSRYFEGISPMLESLTEGRTTMHEQLANHEERITFLVKKGSQPGNIRS
jgi:hypothetical protein